MSTITTPSGETLDRLIKGIRFAMLTTVGADGRLTSRPMSTESGGVDGVLWFFTGRDTHKAADIERHPQVNVSYADPGSQRYVSVTGRAELVDDRARMRRLWSPAYSVWFPKGVDDPGLALLKVTAEHADYWEGPPTWIGRMVAFAQAMITGDAGHVESRGHVDLRR